METKFETDALVELFGHSRIAGTITEQSIGGATFIRIDVPETKTQPSFTRFFHPNAIYAINPVTREIVLELAETIQSKPVNSYDVSEVVAKHMEAKKLLHQGNVESFRELPEQKYDDDDIGF